MILAAWQQLLLCIAGLAFADGAWQSPQLQNLLNQTRVLHTKRQEVQHYIEERAGRVNATWSATHEYFSSHSKGIVMTVKGTDMLLNAVVVAKVIRSNLSSGLPIEIFHFGPEELDDRLVQEAKDVTNLTVVDGSKRPYPSHHRRVSVKGYAAKAWALYMTAFSQVLLLDCDSQPLQDPNLLFESRDFQERGNIFWPDHFGAGPPDPWNTSARDVAYFLLDLEVPWKSKLPGADAAWSSTESGQLYFDRSRHWDVLEYIMLINTHADTFYQYMLGDKDSYEMAFMLANKHWCFFQMPHKPRLALSDLILPAKPHSKATKPYHQILGKFQSSPEGEAMFFHRTMNKLKPVSSPDMQLLVPTLMTEPIGAQKFIRHLHYEPDIHRQHPDWPGEDNKALQQSSVKVAASCGDVTGEQDTKVIQKQLYLQAQMPLCNGENVSEASKAVIAIPLQWIDASSLAGMYAAYGFLEEAMTSFLWHDHMQKLTRSYSLINARVQEA